ncbi:MAG: hypothetical protein QHH10_08015 [Peptococcaceae bacterium]|jgi:hypothetical protein|nr:hypothetical protein [Peptococcaceae bacterium]MDH7525245.1 hypothetical protein [Peptococcaceae bacterium]
MLKQAVLAFLPELTAIESKTRRILTKNAGFAFIEENYPLDRENRLWLPACCLLSAKLVRDTNIKVVQLAGILHLLNYASRLHWMLPGSDGASGEKQKTKLTILAGDLLYSQVYYDICRYGLKQYLSPLTSLIKSIHEEMVLMDYSKQQHLPVRRHEIRIYALISGSACFLGAHAAAGSTYITEKLREIGYHLGILRGVSETGEPVTEYLTNWQQCWDHLQLLPASPERDIFSGMLLYLGEKWGLQQPSLLKGCM